MEKNKNLWIPGDTARFSELKRSLPLFLNDSKTELVCNKKKAIEDVNSRAVSGTQNVDICSWEYAPNFQPGFGLFSDCPYGPQSAWTYDSPASRNMSRLAASDYDRERSSLGKGVESDSTIAFSVSDQVNDPISFLNFGDPDYLLNQIDEYDWFSENAFSGGVTFNKANEILTSASQTFETGSGYIGQVDPTHNEMITDLSMETTYDNVDSSIASLDLNINESDRSFLYLEGFQYDPPAYKPSGRTDRSYDLVRSQSLVQPSEILQQAVGMKDYSLPNLEPSVDIAAASISTNEDITRTKVKKKTTTQKKSGNMGQTTQTLFPPNVRSMLATGVFDGIPVKYVPSSRDMISLDGIIRGGNYLCSCKGCNGHKALTASEFEIHAGCKTKQPNRRIYFESGKSVAEAVHELRSTPASEILEVTKTISGSLIDEARLCMWKDAYEAAAAGATKFRSKSGISKSS